MSEKKEPAKIGVRLIMAPTQKNDTPQTPIHKAETSVSLEAENERNAGEWLEHPYNFDGLEFLASHSTILPQCITAYKNNVTGFGISIDYKDEYMQWDEKEHPEMVAEYEKVERIIDMLSLDCSTKDMFGSIIATRERFGIAYMEVVRNLDGEVVEINNIRRPGTVHMTKPLMPYVNTTCYIKGQPLQRPKKFRKYRQEVAGETVYFKEFGDPRVMDIRTGVYVEDGTLEYSKRANELLALTIGDRPYGEVRWFGQVNSMDGAYKAERLNSNYFSNGRHTPMMIMIEGGTLSDESFKKLTGYMDEIKGESGQHAFIVLETETKNAVASSLDDAVAPKITVKDLSPMLQKDELFQGYIDNARKKVQSAFLLPDLYVGYTTDFNRATAITAMEVTEKQVFIPQRQELAWIINRKLLNEYQFQFCEISFRAPDVTNPDDQSKILEIAERAGGITPNEAHRMVATMTGNTAEDFQGDWADIPVTVKNTFTDGSQSAPAAHTQLSPDVMQQVDARIEEALHSGDNELIAVMKQIRKALTELGGDAGEAET